MHVLYMRCDARTLRLLDRLRSQIMSNLPAGSPKVSRQRAIAMLIERASEGVAK